MESQSQTTPEIDFNFLIEKAKTCADLRRREAIRLEKEAKLACRYFLDVCQECKIVPSSDHYGVKHNGHYRVAGYVLIEKSSGALVAAASQAHHKNPDRPLEEGDFDKLSRAQWVEVVKELPTLITELTRYSQELAENTRKAADMAQRLRQAFEEERDEAEA